MKSDNYPGYFGGIVVECFVGFDERLILSNK